MKSLLCRFTACLTVLFVCVAGGCRLDSDVVTVGAKDFDEQKVLAHLLTQVLAGNGVRTAPVRVCGDTYSCHRELSEGLIDVMVEYSGTGTVFLGKSLSGEEPAWEELAREYDRLGIKWLSPLGFSNTYVIGVRADTAASSGIRTLSDLPRLGSALRFACPAKYLRRPLDGLAPLLRRHGLMQGPRPKVAAAPEQRARLLFEGAVDAVVLYSTDGVTEDPRIAVLEDSQGFFPEYAASVVVSGRIYDANQELREALASLSGALDNDTMRVLNYQVQAEARSPADVAAAWLSARDNTVRTGSKRRGDLIVAVDRSDPLDAFTARSLRAVRQVFPERTLHLAPVEDSFDAVHRGRARMAVVGAERFFMPDLVPPKRDTRLEALAVVGHRVLLLVTRTAADSDPLEGRVAAPPNRTGGGLAATSILSYHSRKAASALSSGQALNALKAGTVDSAFVYLAPDDPDLVAMLAGTHARPVDLGPWLPPGLSSEAPYLRPVRIAAGTYPGQTAPLDTVSAQVVLAGPGRNLYHKAAAGGPAAALPAAGRPVLFETARKLADAIDIPEAPDPVLPSAWTSPTGPDQGARTANKFQEVLLNVLVLLFLAWLGWLAAKRSQQKNQQSE